MIRTLTTALALALTAAPAMAQTAPGQWSFGFGAGTDNRSKDVSKSMGQEYVWATGEWESDSGFFYVDGGLEGIESNGSDTEGKLGLGRSAPDRGLRPGPERDAQMAARRQSGRRRRRLGVHRQSFALDRPGQGASATPALARRHGVDQGLDLGRGARGLGLQRNPFGQRRHRPPRTGRRHRLHRL